MKDRINNIGLIAGAIFIVMGAVLLTIRAFTIDTVQASGLLNENFFLVPLAFLALLIGVVIILALGVRSIIKLRKISEEEEKKQYKVTNIISTVTFVMSLILLGLLVYANSPR